MHVNIGNAVKKFFPNPSLELVYFEAIANAIDAGATEVVIDISVSEINLPDTLSIEIRDNGSGFDDERFGKFNQLLSSDDKTRKGIGRLVYLNYFSAIEFESYFNGVRRDFTFTESFEGRKTDRSSDSDATGTIIRFRNYSKSKIAKGDYLDPAWLANSIKLHFYPTFLAAKEKGKELSITINRKTGGESAFFDDAPPSEIVTASDFPKFKTIEIPFTGFFSLFPFHLKYSIQGNQSEKLALTLASIDDRTVDLDLISASSMPSGYHIVFILESDALKGKSNSSRVELDMTPAEVKALKQSVLKAVGKVLEDELPEIAVKNKEKMNAIEEKYPHLNGYFESFEIGLLDSATVLERAQKRFFDDQKEILEAQELDDAQFERSLEQSSRILAEYILYRTKIIGKLQRVDSKKDESYIHNLIAPQRREYLQANLQNDFFVNNAWILDDKYMNYHTILSERDISALYDHIGIESEEKTDARPDISVIMSDDVDEDRKVDVVIVELKKLGLKLARKEEVISQLKQRARILLEHYPNKIQRIWFYGVVDLDKEFIRSMKEDAFAELYSSGTLYYKEHSVIAGDDDDAPKIPMGIFIMDYHALIHDAEMRNSCFLKILKSGFKKMYVAPTSEGHLDEYQPIKIPQTQRQQSVF